MDQDEPLLKENPNRFVMFPIQYPKIYEMYKQQVSCFWTPEEVKLIDDLKDWDKLTNDEQFFIKNVLAFFAGSDGIVLENLGQRFMNEIQIPEVKAFYSFQMAMEICHSLTYSLLIDTYIKDVKEKNHLFKAIETIPCVKQKADWALKWIESKKASFASRLVAFASVEGIFFSGSFCAIFWLRERGLMPGLTFSNELISRDEGMHTDHACLLYSMINNKLSQTEIYELIDEAVVIEKQFITESLPCRLIGMNADLMRDYIEYVADRLIVQLGYQKLYHTKNPFGFMERISIESKVNFFEARNHSYERAGIMATKQDNEFAEDADF